MFAVPEERLVIVVTGFTPLDEMMFPIAMTPLEGAEVIVIWFVAKDAVKVTAVTVSVVDPDEMETFMLPVLFVSVSKVVDCVPVARPLSSIPGVERGVST